VICVNKKKKNSIKTNADIYEIQQKLKLNLHDKLPLLDAIVEILNQTANIDPGDWIELEKFVSYFCANVSRRRQKAGPSSEKFLAKIFAWLDLKVKLLVPLAAAHGQ
jgi:hypothetical protein